MTFGTAWFVGKLVLSRREREVYEVSTILGLGLSNWLIWISMALFILIYFVVTERINKREEEASREDEE